MECCEAIARRGRRHCTSVYHVSSGCRIQHVLVASSYRNDTHSMTIHRKTMCTANHFSLFPPPTLSPLVPRTLLLSPHTPHNNNPPHGLKKQVMGSLDDFVITPHSSFSELGSTLSFTWLSDYQTALRILPNRPLMPIFAHMNEFERRKVMSLLDRRAAPIKSRSTGQGQAGQQCLRQYAAGMSVVVARGQYLRSMFETIENAECMRKRRVEIAEV